MMNKADIDIGVDNDFKLTIPIEEWSKYGIGENSIWHIPGSETGGIILDYTVITKNGTVEATGEVFRGTLKKHIIEPPDGEDYLIVEGEANRIISNLIKDFLPLFKAEAENSGFIFERYQFERYTDVLSGIEKMLKTIGSKLKLRTGYENGEIRVYVGAAPIVDYSQGLEYGSDNKVNFKARNYKRGINHLICLGKGELKNRLVVHLYLQSDGTIGPTKHYFGIKERTEIYEFNTIEDALELEDNGRKRFKELMDYQKIEIELDETEADLGDIVGGRERITDFYIQKPIVRKIIKISGGKSTITYKVGD